MSRLSRGFALAIVALAFAGVSRAEAQVPVADAQAFLGAWTVSIDAQGQTLAMSVNITNEGGNVAAEVGSDLGNQKVSQISKNADKLVLTYSLDAQGQVIPIIMTLAPTDAGLDATLDIAGGMMTAAGKGTKR